jgi:hypothetical protein
VASANQPPMSCCPRWCAARAPRIFVPYPVDTASMIPNHIGRSIFVPAFTCTPSADQFCHALGCRVEQEVTYRSTSITLDVPQPGYIELKRARQLLGVCQNGIYIVVRHLLLSRVVVQLRSSVVSSSVCRLN